MPNYPPPPTKILFLKWGFVPDPWQTQVLESEHPRLLLNCCRQAGKTTVVAAMALVWAMFRPMTRVLILSRSHRQSKEMLRIMTIFHDLCGAKILKRKTNEELEFKHLSRIVSAPCKEETIRGFTADIIIIDEAARVPDDLYRAVRPMLAMTKGRLILLSTPHGRRGFFWDAWARGGDDWLRIEVPAEQCPRISPEFLAEERRTLGESYYRQEYGCSFESVEGLVYPDLGARVLIPETPAGLVKFVPRPGESVQRYGLDGPDPVGGIDFGFRNPFAAVWGLYHDDVLYLTGEHYQRQRPLSHHFQFLPRDVVWTLDPSGANEMAEMRRADFSVRKGNNDIAFGLSLVQARIEQGGLKIVRGACPNLLAEAGLYRYESSVGARRTEIPVDANNHALGALRYLISKLPRMEGRRS